MMRCVNIDWLECYCFEPKPQGADYFLSLGYSVNVREYGTRQYREMFTVLDKDGHGFIEVRRAPVAAALNGERRGMFSRFSCHLRLVNRYCYAENAVDLYADFLYKHGYVVQRIYRLDIAYDFEKFDDGTDPKKFLQRYMAGKFTKINQGNISAHGKDLWECRDWNSVSWGAPNSMVGAKFYLKTLELKQVKDKPYIRYAWWCAGLVDDWISLTKSRPDGSAYQPDIWRIEFSIRSSARGWVIVENHEGKKPKQITLEHCLDTYDNRNKLISAFEQLARHYFRFKIYQEGVRKDLCKERVLFKWSDSRVYKLDRLMTDEPVHKDLSALARRIEAYRIAHFDTAVRKACDIILSQIQRENIVHALPVYESNEAKLLQLLIARRLNNPDEQLTQSIDTVKALISLSHDIF